MKILLSPEIHGCPVRKDIIMQMINTIVLSHIYKDIHVNKPALLYISHTSTHAHITYNHSRTYHIQALMHTPHIQLVERKKNNLQLHFQLFQFVNSHCIEGPLSALMGDAKGGNCSSLKE